MPLPKPNSGENKDDFISRFMGNEEAKKKFPEQDQRLAVAFSQWKEKNEMKTYRDLKDELNETVNKKEKDLLQSIAKEIEGKALMDIRKDLEKFFKKKDIDFTTSPIPAYHIKQKNGDTLVILNKKYVNKPDVEVGQLALGFLR